eukprot:Anaeramoba_ignava/a479150_33.p2 GENE.a479150_33~~a479150_33.p2  ORF type:complete len:166 (-),score=21.61 a479150_33:1354-1851(-)
MKFEKAVQKYKNRIFGYIIRNVSSREDAEDIFQSVFVSLYKNYNNVDEKTLSAYIYRIAHNRIVDYYKHSSRKKDKEQEIIHNSIAPDEDMYTERRVDSKNEKIRNALNQLSERENQAINLQFYEKRSYKEIAEIMNTTSSAIDSLLIRAKRKLKKIISQEIATS